MTVASANTRALRTVRGLAFEPAGRFSSAVDGRGLEVLVRRER